MDPNRERKLYLHTADNIANFLAQRNVCGASLAFAANLARCLHAVSSLMAKTDKVNEVCAVVQNYVDTTKL